MKSFIKWIGGKQRIAKRIVKLFPDRSSIRKYVEPFVGAGSIYFAYGPNEAMLSDINANLIEAYNAVKSSPDLVYKHLAKHKEKNTKKYYLKVRSTYNQTKSSDRCSRAAAFIYLNKASFNGIWRVNRCGEFNVPYAHRKKLCFPSYDDLLSYSTLLSSAEILCLDYKEAMKRCGKGDFIYIDPPYPPLNSTSYFTHYSQNRFGLADQKSLAEEVVRSSNKGSHFLMTNASLPIIRDLYRGFKMSEIDVVRWVRADGKRYSVKELVILNY